jgi:hypothetical protein
MVHWFDVLVQWLIVIASLAGSMLDVWLLTGWLWLDI